MSSIKKEKIWKHSQPAILALFLASCGSNESSSTQDRSAATNANISGSASQSVPIRMDTGSKTSSSSDAVDKTLAQSAAADRQMREKSMQNQKDQLGMLLAQQDAQSKSSNQIRMVEQLTAGLAILAGADALKYTVTPDSRKCYRSGSYSALSKELRQITDFSSKTASNQVSSAEKDGGKSPNPPPSNIPPDTSRSSGPTKT